MSSKHSILCLGNNFPFDTCLAIAFSPPPDWIRAIRERRSEIRDVIAEVFSCGVYLVVRLLLFLWKSRAHLKLCTLPINLRPYYGVGVEVERGCWLDAPAPFLTGKVESRKPPPDLRRSLYCSSRD